MKIFKVYYYDLWKDMPLWLVVISFLILYPVFLIIKSPEIALINALGIYVVLSLTSLLMCGFKNVSLFRNAGRLKRKFFVRPLRMSFFLISSVLVLTGIELIMQSFFYKQYIVFGVYFPYFCIPCLVLSRYGEYAVKNTMGDTLSYCFSMGVGFGVFLAGIGFVSLILSEYGSPALLSTAISLAGFALMVGISRFRAISGVKRVVGG